MNKGTAEGSPTMARRRVSRAAPAKKTKTRTNIRRGWGSDIRRGWGFDTSKPKAGKALVAAKKTKKKKRSSGPSLATRRKRRSSRKRA